MPRNNKILLRLTKEEFEKISKKANQVGMKLSCYIRFVCLSSKISVNKNQIDY